MSESTADAAVQFLIEKRNRNKHLSIIFMGGEPLLEYNIIRRIVHTVNRALSNSGQSYRFDVTTNGTLLSERSMKFFSANKVKVLISVDGDRETHNRTRRDDKGGTWDRIAELLPMVKRYQPYMGAKATVIPSDADRVFHNVKTLAQMGFNKIIMGPASGIDWPENAFNTFKEQVKKTLEWLKKQKRHTHLQTNFEDAVRESVHCDKDNRWGCRAGRTGVVVNWDGMIFPCSKMLGVGGTEGLIPLGNVWEGLTETESRRRLCGFIPATRRKCYTCRFPASCTGGCFATNFEATGDPFKPDPLGCRTEALFRSLAENEPDKNEQTKQREVSR